MLSVLLETDLLTFKLRYTKFSSSKLAVEADNTLNLTALKSSEVLSFLARLQWLVSTRSVYLKVSMFQSTEPLYAIESFIKRVLKRGTISESRALIEYEKITLLRYAVAQGDRQPSFINLMHAFKNS